MPTIKILLVEDEKTLVQIVSETLRSKGFTVETAYDGAEASNASSKSALTFSLPM